MVLIDLESATVQEGGQPPLKRPKLAHQSSTVNISVTGKAGASASGGSVANATQVSVATGGASTAKQ